MNYGSNKLWIWTTWEPKYYADYIGGMKIYQLDRANNATYVVELFEVYPKTITAQDIGNATSDAYQTVTVELDFHHWIWSDEATNPRRLVSSVQLKNNPTYKLMILLEWMQLIKEES